MNRGFLVTNELYFRKFEEFGHFKVYFYGQSATLYFRLPEFRLKMYFLQTLAIYVASK